MINRLAVESVTESLEFQPSVAILGIRQVGKTTLAQQVGGPDALYLDLEKPVDRAKALEPELLVRNYKDRLIIFDEVHRVPELFPILRGLIDSGRTEGLTAGRFLLLGSASLELLKTSGESLAGRISYVDLDPLCPLEVIPVGIDLDKLWLRGGLPPSLLAKSDRQSAIWRHAYIRSYLERDIPQFGLGTPASTLSRFWTMLAHRQGGVLNAADLARGVEVSTQSVLRYVDFLCDLLLLRRLPPFVANTEKRLVKSPKIYVRDSGLVHSLLGIETLDQLLGHPVAGSSWEGLVIESLIDIAGWGVQSSFFRTVAGSEVDLVMEFYDEMWAIEVKRSLNARPTRGFYNALQDLKPNRAFVVHAGSERYPVAEGVEGIGLLELCEAVRQKRR